MIPDILYRYSMRNRRPPRDDIQSQLSSISRKYNFDTHAWDPSPGTSSLDSDRYI